jgi:hypothetical protein
MCLQVCVLQACALQLQAAKFAGTTASVHYIFFLQALRRCLQRQAELQSAACRLNSACAAVAQLQEELQVNLSASFEPQTLNRMVLLTSAEAIRVLLQACLMEALHVYR